MEQVSGQVPSSSIHHMNDGFFYLRYQTTNSTQYFRCTYWRQGCPSRGNISGDNDFQLTNGHNHGPDRTDRAEALSVRQLLLDQARNPDSGRIQDILINARIDDPLNRQYLYRSMTRARSQTLPMVQNLTELRAILENASFSWLTAYSDHVEHTGYRGSVQAPDGSQVLLFLSKKCGQFLQIVSTIFIIKTPKIISNQQHTLITVATFWDRNEIILAWLLYESSNADAFFAGFSLLRTQSLTAGHRFRKAFCSRNEVADAFHRVFPLVKIQPSFFDCINEVKTNVQIAESIRVLLQNPAGVKVIKLCCAFLLMPRDLLQIGLNQIILEAESASEEVRCHSLVLFNFIETQWLNSDTFEINFCGNVEGTNYSVPHLGLKLERDCLRTANDFYPFIKYITSSITRANQKIAIAVSGSSLRSSVPVPIAAEQPYWHLLTGTGFPQEIRATNILNYVCTKLLF